MILRLLKFYLNGLNIFEFYQFVNQFLLSGPLGRRCFIYNLGRVLFPTRKGIQMKLLRMKTFFPLVLTFLVGSCSLRGAHATIEFSGLGVDGESVALALDLEESITADTFGELISRKLAEGVPYTIAIIRSEYLQYHFFDDEALRKALAYRMENPLTAMPIKPEDIIRYNITGLGIAPVRVIDEPADMDQPTVVTEERGSEGSGITHSSTIHFPSLSVPLVLSQIEYLTGKTFAELIKASFDANRSYIVTIIRASEGVYFFDAEALGNRMIHPISKQPFSSDDVRTFEVYDLNMPPLEVFGDKPALHDGFLPKYSSVPRGAPIVVLELPAAAAAGPLIASDPHIMVMHPMGLSARGFQIAHDARFRRAAEIVAARKLGGIEKTNKYLTIRASAPFIEYDDLSRIYNEVKRKNLGRIRFDRDCEPVNYQVSACEVTVSIESAGLRDKEAVIRLLENDLLKATREALREQPLHLQLEYFQVTCDVFAVFSPLKEAMAAIRQKFMSSEVTKSLMRNRVVTSVKFQNSLPFVFMAKAETGALPGVVYGAPADAASLRFHLDVDRIKIDRAP
jgi:hypothetical protein